MALATIVRRSASKVAPLAGRLIGAPKQTPFSFAFFSSSAFPAPAAYSSTRRHFSSSSNNNLVQILQAEVECALDSDAKELDVPGDFPFTIQDNAGESIITLTRDYEGETITVEVSMPNLITGDEDEDEVEENDAEEEGVTASSVPLLVTVAKKNGPSLEFDVTAYPDEIRINALSLKNPESEDQLSYEGPDFLDLDDNLQKAFHKYLEIRGIKPSATNFLHEYMIEKDAKEYLRWLKDVKKFVEA